MEHLTMKRSELFLGISFLLMFSTAVAHAAKNTTPKWRLEKDATHIVVGKVQSISSTHKVGGSYRLTYYVADILIDRVEKGESLKSGEVVQARYLSRAWVGTGTPPPNDSGHYPTAKQDDYVRVYLVNNGYNGQGYTTDGGYDVYYKNGFEILAPQNR
jgi:hypothetical protein